MEVVHEERTCPTPALEPWSAAGLTRDAHVHSAKAGRTQPEQSSDPSRTHSNEQVGSETALTGRVQYLGTIADHNAYGGGVKQKLRAFGRWWVILDLPMLWKGRGLVVAGFPKKRIPGSVDGNAFN